MPESVQFQEVTPTRIPFNRPSVAGRELDYIRQALDAGRISGNGPFTRRCEAWLEGAVGCPRALLTPSCTAALEMAALLLDIGPGDEVIAPTFTFVSTVNAFVLRGARPVFCDVRADTLNMDESLLEGLLSPRTKAIVPVHYAGVACEMDAILRIAGRQGIAVVEDAAHALLGRYRGRPLGSLGALAALSFHETKNFTCGEGGALLINEARYAERAEILREKGTDRSRFFRGEVDRYTWQDVGSSYLVSDMTAAFLLAQLETADDIQARRKRLWDAYRDGLGAWAADHAVRLPAVPPDCDQAYHLFYLLMPSEEARDALRAHLKADGILGIFHYLPLHTSPMGRRTAPRSAACPVAEDVSRRLVRLPLFSALSEGDQDRVIRSVLRFPWPP